MVEKTFGTSEFRYNNIQYLHSTRSSFDFNPTYQRQSEIWSLERRQLLIDSIFNELDIPKFYVHKITKRQKDGSTTNFALVDGKQRLNAILGFMDNKFALASDIKLFDDPNLQIGDYTYSELQREYPQLAIKFASTPLDIVVVDTNDIELIEEMFHRLNEAVPLNAAEKRNALGGPLPAIVRKLSEHPFFATKLPFTNSRYRHFDLGAKFMYWSDSDSKDNFISQGKPAVRDTKKQRLDQYFLSMKASSSGASDSALALSLTEKVLDDMVKVFTDADPLLRSLGMVQLYYLYYLRVTQTGAHGAERSDLALFDVARDLADFSDSKMAPGDYQFVEFARLSQSPNDGGALQYRLLVLETWLAAVRSAKDPRRALAALAA